MFAGNRCGSAAGADTGAEQRFVGVNVSDPPEEFLVEQGAFDGRLAGSEEADETVEIDLEGLDAASIGDITGISAGNVATKVHRVKKVLAQRFQRGTP